MQKKRFLSVLFVTLLMTGCAPKPFEDPYGSGDVKLERIEISKVNTSFYTGDIYRDNLGVELVGIYSDKSVKPIQNGYESYVGDFYSVDGYPCSATAGVNYAGLYSSTLIATYKLDGKKFTTSKSATVEFKSVFEELDDNCTNLKISINNVYKPQMRVSDDLDFTLEMDWEHHGKEIRRFTSIYAKFNLTLSTLGSEIEIDSLLDRNNTYTLSATIGAASASCDFAPLLGVIKVDKEDLTIDSHLMNKFYSPSSYNSKVLVVPVNLWSDDTTVDLSDYTTSDLPYLENLYFGDDDTTVDNISFKKYYEKIGINFSGVVTIPYERDTTMSEQEIETLRFEKVFDPKRPGNGLFSCIAQTFEWVKENYPLDWELFDTDQNGSIDNIHFLFNYNGTSWGTSLWPHQGFTGNTKGTLEDEKVNVYCVGARNKLNNAITQIHEQGHVLGLLDYYDYTDRSQSQINYIGHIDMQSDNIMDWNSYSKLANKLVSPYVTTGSEDEVTIEIGDAATTGDCLIIPADYNTWNGSAFDEYFLIELFSKKGVNELFWDNCPSLSGSEDYGVRVYHVDSRIYDMVNQKEVSDDPSTWSSYCQIGANNSYDYTAMGTGNPAEFKDFKQIVLIQAGGVDTFGDSPTSTDHKYLELDDMFYTGDHFDFEFAKKFLSKTHRDDITGMDNGETFPYTIYFDSVSKDSATIRIVKN